MACISVVLVYDPMLKYEHCVQLKGEKELVEKILQAEINFFLSIRDGSGLMQHMEDFYYITLLEVLSLSMIISINYFLLWLMSSM